jgi:purine-nucleoside phosphorylase
MASSTVNAVIDPKDLASEAAAQIRQLTGVETHDIAITLGSGWGGAAKHFGEPRAVIDAGQLAGFHRSEVVGHSGTLSSVQLENGRNVLILGARAHLYQGLGVDAVVHPVRVAAALGVKTLVLTNGAGGIKPHWKPGTPVLISDHINLTATTPLRGATFIDMSEAYSRNLRDIARTVDPSLDEGVYVQFSGPSYETPAEVRMARAMGGDIVGMSTALEVIAAREAGLDVLGLSLITNLAAGISETPLSHAEVLEAGREAEGRLAILLSTIVSRLP